MEITSYREVKDAQLSSDGNATFDAITAVTGKKLRVVSGVISAAALMTLQFQSRVGSATATDLTGKGIHFPAAGAVVLPFNESGYFETAIGGKLQVVSDAAGEVGGVLNYIEI